MIDVHCHLNFHSFQKDYDAVIKDAKKAGVDIIINVGTQVDSSQKAVELADEYDNLYAIIGIHPHHADKATDSDIEALRTLTLSARTSNPKPRTSPTVLAIGEIGLDYHSYESNGIVDPKVQKHIFEAQIQLAHDLKLPLQIHNRHAGKDIVEILNHHKNLLQPIPGMFHCFAGDMNVLNAILNLGFYIGFDGNLTYPGLAPEETTKLSDLAKETPLNRIVTETDSPFLTPIPHRGTRNSPAYVIIVAKEIARIKNLSFEKVAQTTTQNAKTLFNLKPIT